MRPPLTVAVAQPVVDPHDLVATVAAHAGAVRDAAARLVVFPELSLSGYELDAPAPRLDGPRLRPLVEACRRACAVALVGAPLETDGRRHIAMLRVDADGIAVAYRKTHLGGDEVTRFAPGGGPAAVDVDGWRVGLAICKDTGVAEHTRGTADLHVDLYAAGLVHHVGELDEQDRRGERIARACNAYVAFASFAGATGGGYDRTAGRSTIWSPDGAVLARAGAAPGEWSGTTLT